MISPASFAVDGSTPDTSETILVGLGGVLNATNTIFSRLNGTSNSSNTSLIQVDPGGQLTMIGGSLGWNGVTLLSGSTDTIQYSFFGTKLAVDSGATITIKNDDFSVATVVARPVRRERRST